MSSNNFNLIRESNVKLIKKCITFENKTVPDELMRYINHIDSELQNLDINWQKCKNINLTTLGSYISHVYIDDSIEYIEYCNGTINVDNNHVIVYHKKKGYVDKPNLIIISSLNHVSINYSVIFPERTFYLTINLYYKT
jgi:hypothetical protein